MMQKIQNISAYKFVALNHYNLPELRLTMREKTRAWGLKGSIILSAEGVNLFVAGTDEQIATLQDYLHSFPELADLTYKVSFSDKVPFRKMLVKFKAEIIPMGLSSIQPAQHTAEHLAPEQFREMYRQGVDMLVLDTRNDFEVKVGTFKNALNLHLKNFREFPEAVKQLPSVYKHKPVVTFCTGGIRCEKAAELMVQMGFEQVYQLDGGILNYFEKCQGDYYDGECFVFDQRVALNPILAETPTIQCFACRMPITQAQQETLQGVCPHCQHVSSGRSQQVAKSVQNLE